MAPTLVACDLYNKSRQICSICIGSRPIKFGKSVRSSKDNIAGFLNKILPKKIAYPIIRFKSITFQVLFFAVSRKWPLKVKNFIVSNVQKGLGEDFPVEPHFVPNYNPWEQRFCLAPDGDFYKAIKARKADIVTDHIDHFTPKGILLKSGQELEADIVVTATGLNLLAFGGVNLLVDNKEVNLVDKYVYKGLMLNDVPNIIFFVGYTNASWTLKSDLTSKYASRVINYMDKNKKTIFNIETRNEEIEKVPILNLDSSYIKRNEHLFPKQGSKTPWRVYQNYFLDFFFLRVKSITVQSALDGIGIITAQIASYIFLTRTAEGLVIERILHAYPNIGLVTFLSRTKNYSSLRASKT
mgnify:CR=1 FL=1